MKRILFSAVGSTDPIAGQHDGAILHILRHYDVDEVYLYYSKEMCELEEKDNRYLYCIEKLQELKGVNFTINKLKRPEVVDVHIFDFFLKEFKTLTDEILKEEDCELLLNVSSGTPAMKSALQLIGVISDRKVTTVQVSTPGKAYNDSREDVKGDYEVELQWELNMDNEESHINRCAVSSDINYTFELKKEIIKKQIDSFDYVAARDIALTMQEFLNPEAVALLQAAAYRIKLDRKQCLKYLKNIKYTMYPHQSSNECDVFEAFMLSKIKIYREEYIDFLRGISPLFFALLEKIIYKQFGVDLNDYYNVTKGLNGTMFKKWDPKKVIKNEELYNALTKDGKYDLRSNPAGSAQLSEYIERKAIDKTMIEIITNVRNIEESVRNPVAHCITYLSEEVIRAETGMGAKGIFNEIKRLMIYAGIKVTEDDLLTYENLNKEIKKYL